MASDLTPWRRRSRLPVRQQQQEERDPFTALQRRMNRLFEDFTRGFEMTPFGEQNWMPRVNVSENDKEVCVTAELPGMEEKDLDVTLAKNALTLKGEKKEEREEKDRNYHRVERTYGSFYREIPLPVEVEADKVDAKFKNGVLTVTLPKSHQAQAAAKKVTVKSA